MTQAQTDRRSQRHVIVRAVFNRAADMENQSTRQPIHEDFERLEAAGQPYDVPNPEADTAFAGALIDLAANCFLRLVDLADTGEMPVIEAAAARTPDRFAPQPRRMTRQGQRARVDALMDMVERFARDYIDIPHPDAARDEIHDAIVDVAVAAAEDVASAIQERIPDKTPDVPAARVQGAWRDAAMVALDRATEFSNLK